MRGLLYISGPMTGYPEANYPAFSKASIQLTEVGYSVISPHSIGHVPGWTWTDYMRQCLLLILAAGPNLTGVATLPDGPTDGYPPSRGRAFEIAVATTLGIPVMSVDEWAARDN